MKKLLFLLSLIISINSCKKDGSEDEIPTSSKTPYWEIDLTIDGTHYEYKSKARDASSLNSYARVESYLNDGWWIDIIGNKSDPEYISGKSLPRSVFVIYNGILGFIYNWSFTTTPLPGYFEAGPIEYSIIQNPELAEINTDNFQITYKKPMIIEIPLQTVKADFAKSSVEIEGKIIAYRDIL